MSDKGLSASPAITQATSGDTGDLMYAVIGGNSRAMHFANFFKHAPSGSFDTLSLVDDEADFVQVYDTSAGAWKKALGKNLGFTQAGAGASLRSLQSKLRETVSPEDFGAVGDGATDDTTAFTRASTYLAGVGGGVIKLTHGKNYLIDSNLSLGTAVAIQGHVRVPAGQAGTDTDTLRSGRLTLNPSATITLNALGSGLSGVAIIRKSLTFPATGATALTWTGTAVTIGNGAAHTFVTDAIIIGFNKAISCEAAFNQRQLFERVHMDCRNGIHVTNAFDTVTIRHCRCWPYANQYLVGATDEDNYRDGIAYYVYGIADLTILEKNFSICYATGYKFEGCGRVIVEGCAADGFVYLSDTISDLGFHFLDCTEVRLLNCEADGMNQDGFRIDCDRIPDPPADFARPAIHLFGCRAFDCANSGISILQGEGSILGCDITQCTDGIRFADNADANYWLVDNNYIHSVNACLRFDGATATNVKIGSANFFRSFVSAIATVNVIPTVASAASLVPAIYSDVMYVSGTTGITGISTSHTWQGREVTLIFLDALTITASGTLVLVGAANFATSTGDILRFVYDGNGTWRQTGIAAQLRTANLLDDSVTDAKLRNSAALSVIGRSANTSGDPADIAAANDGEVLRRSGTSLGFGTVATAGIANDAVTFAKMQNIASDRLIGRDTASSGDPEEISLPAGGGLAFNGAQGLVLAAGAVVQSAYAEYTTNADLSTDIPNDDSIPQVTEGTEVLSVVITPGSATNKLRCRFRGSGAAADPGITVLPILAAMFVNGGADAVAADQAGPADAAVASVQSKLDIEYEYTPGATSAQTISVRVGPPAGTATVARLNGSHTARLLGGSQRATLVVEEIKA